MIYQVQTIDEFENICLLQHNLKLRPCIFVTPQVQLELTSLVLLFKELSKMRGIKSQYVIFVYYLLN